MPIQPDLFEDNSKFHETEILNQTIEPISIQKDIPGVGLAELVPSKALLVLTYQYTVDAIHISKILKYLYQINSHDVVIVKTEIGNELSITWNRTRGTFYVIKEIGLITSKNKLCSRILNYESYWIK